MFDVVLPEVDPHGHCGDTFRELAVLWGKRNLCRIVFKETSHVWFSKIGHVILYDRPRLDWFDYTTQFEGVLWGNTVTGNSMDILGKAPNTHGEKLSQKQNI